MGTTTPESERQMEQIAAAMECPKDFECRKAGLEDLCKCKYLGHQDNDLVECLDEDRQRCRFSLPFGKSYFCKCPLRVFIAKMFGK